MWHNTVLEKTIKRERELIYQTKQINKVILHEEVPLLVMNGPQAKMNWFFC